MDAPGDDAATIAFYDGAAEAYAKWSAPTDPTVELDAFMAAFAPGAAVLDLGCSGGWAAGAMAARGFAVEAMDASPELAAEARRGYGVPVRVARFEELEAVAKYDGIWASFSLLHTPKSAMAGSLARIHRALRPAGRVYVGLKQDEGEGRDELCRFYAYYAPAEISALLTAAGFADIAITQDTSESYDGAQSRGLHVFAIRAG